MVRLFGYYAWHTFKNTVKKLCRTWVVIFIIACMVIGGGIGFGVAMLEDASENKEQDIGIEWIESETGVNVEIIEGGHSDIEEIVNDSAEGKPSMFDLDDEGLHLTMKNSDAVCIAWNQLLEAGAMLLIIVVLLFSMMGADKRGSKIFTMADVNLLFAAPMKPQSVLLFRLLTQMGTVLLGTIYLLFQMPNLILNAGLSTLAAFAILAVWFGTLLTGKLLQVFLYTYFSTRPEKKKYLSRILWGIIFLLIGLVFAYGTAKNKLYPEALAECFSLPFTRWIPIVGWLKSLFLFVVEEEFGMAALFAVLIVLQSVLLVWVIWRMKADFYEDAMAKSEETAAILKDAQEGRSIITRKSNKKDRSDKLRRDNMKHGSGANVFFFKSMYNRFRFAAFGFATKTMMTYLALAAGTLLTGHMFLDGMNFTMTSLAVGVFVFFRSLGNPLEQDTSMGFFHLIPESTWSKLFWSLLGGTVNCLLDILPALVVAAIATRTSPLTLIGFVLLIVSVDFYSTIVGAFINISIPVNAGKMVKQFIQILFIYFGLLPDIGLLAVGLVMDMFLRMAVIAVLVNLALGLIFLMLTPLFLDPYCKPVRNTEALEGENLKKAVRDFRYIGLGLFAIMGINMALQLGFAFIAALKWPELLDASMTMWILTVVPLYCVGLPVGLFFMRRVESRPVKEGSWKVTSLLKLVCISVFVMYTGNILGNVINNMISPAIENPLTEYVMNGELWLRILVMVIIAPFGEEFIFRKSLIDRMHVYGEKTAVITSALAFGLFHGNFSQFFYAAGLGLVFGYLYVRSGKLRYSIGFHMGINFLGAVVAPKMVEIAQHDLDIINRAVEITAETRMDGGIVIYMIYALIMLVLAIAGLVLLCMNWRNIHFEPAEHELAKGQIFKTVWLNIGMILFVIVCAVLFVLNIVGS